MVLTGKKEVTLPIEGSDIPPLLFSTPLLATYAFSFLLYVSEHRMEVSAYYEQTDTVQFGARV